MADDKGQNSGSRRIEQIVELAAHGLTDKHIASALGISVTAVIKHLQETIAQQSRQLEEMQAAQQRLHECCQEHLAVVMAEGHRQVVDLE